MVAKEHLLNTIRNAQRDRRSVFFSGLQAPALSLCAINWTVPELTVAQRRAWRRVLDPMAIDVVERKSREARLRLARRR